MKYKRTVIIKSKRERNILNSSSWFPRIVAWHTSTSSCLIFILLTPHLLPLLFYHHSLNAHIHLIIIYVTHPHNDIYFLNKYRMITAISVLPLFTSLYLSQDGIWDCTMCVLIIMEWSNMTRQPEIFFPFLFHMFIWFNIKIWDNQRWKQVALSYQIIWISRFTFCHFTFHISYVYIFIFFYFSNKSLLIYFIF